jgi:hypothetical protein
VLNTSPLGWFLIMNGGGSSGPTVDFRRITDEGETRITDDDAIRVTDEEAA